MSKLETQRTLPRRKLFRRADEIPCIGGFLMIGPKPKRKAKKAKGKR